MGKHSRKSKESQRSVSEIDERERIKASIIQVFRDYCSSNEEGAVLVGPTPTKKKTKRFESSSCSDNASPHGMSGKKRPRKKLSAVRRKKIQTNSKKKNVKEVEDNQAVSRHMKVAHGIMQVSRFDRGDIAETRSLHAPRLTNRIGLFNTGKKSAPASRGLLVPPHINEKTNEGIRRIVAEADSDLNGSAGVDGTSLIEPGSQMSWMSSVHTQTPTSVEMKPKPTPSPSPCVVQTCDHLDIKDTVKQLMYKLKSVRKMMFPGRNVLVETRLELMKLLRQNAPRSATPTPIPVLNKASRLGSVQRSLLESFTSVTQTHPENMQVLRGQREHVSSHQPCLQSVDEHSYTTDHGNDITVRNSLSQIRKSDKSLAYSIDSSCKEAVKYFLQKPSTVGSQVLQTFHDELKHDNSIMQNNNKIPLPQSIFKNVTSNHSDNTDTLACRPSGDFSAFFPDEKETINDDYFCANHTMPLEPVLESLKPRAIPEFPEPSSTATALLEQNDIKIGSQELERMEFDHRDNEALNLLHQNDKMSGCHLSTSNIRTTSISNNRQPGLSSSIFSDEDVSSRYSHLPRSSEVNVEVLTSRTGSASYMPSFHGNYYASHMSDLSWQPATGTDWKSWDLLDYADVDMGHEVSPEHKQTDKPAKQHVDVTRWPTTDHHLHLRSLIPPTENSPGLKLYPRKMY